MVFKSYRFFMVILVTILLTACGTFGSGYLPKNHQAFNNAAVRTMSEQMLLNLVRLRYDDAPYFLQLDNITSQLSRDVSTDLSYDGTQSSAWVAASISKSLNPSLTISEAPTFSFTPLQGENFTKRVLKPFNIDDIYIYIESGWSIARIFRIMLQRLGPVINANNASRATSSHMPHYKEFRKISYHFEQLHNKGLLTFHLVQINKLRYIELRFKKGMPSEMAKTLNVPWHSKAILIGSKQKHKDVHYPIVDFEARSFISGLYYLSKGTHVPPEHIKNRVVRNTFDEKHQLFDWTDVTKYVIQIQSSKSRPCDAATSVFYRGYWFYIADTDHNAKQTMTLLLQFYALLGSSNTRNIPQYTIAL